MSLNRQLLALALVGLACIAGLAASAPPAIAAEPKWNELTTPHFTILANVGPRETRSVALQFEQFRNVFDRMTNGGIRKGEHPITVIAVRNEDDLRVLLPEYWADRKQAKPAGLFMPGLDRHHVVLRLDASKEAAAVSGELGYEANPYHAIFHEYVHALVQNIARLPAWLNEGLAEFYAGARIDKDRVLLGRPQALTILYLRERSLLPLPELLSATVDSPLYKDADKAQLFYAQSWALLHFLRIGRASGRAPVIEAYRQKMEEGADSVTAAGAAFGDLARLQSDLNAYVKSTIFRMEVFPGATTVDTSAWIERAPTDTERDLLLGRFHAASGRSELATTLVSRLVAASPTSADIADVTALLACRQGHSADCLTQARNAIALGSSSGLTYFFAANALLSGGPLGAALGEVQQLLEQSLERQPDLAPAQWTLANVYVAMGRPPREALALAQRAIDIAPREVGPYLAAADALMADGRSADAIRIAEQGVRYASTDDQRTRAREFVEQLKQTADAPPAVAVAAAPAPAAVPVSSGPAAIPGQPPSPPSSPPRASEPAPSIRFTFRFDPMGRDFTAWKEAFSMQLQTKAAFPQSVLSKTGHVGLGLTVRKDGSLGEIRVLQPSGVRGFDEAVRKALADSKLAVPLPPDYPAAELAVTLTFAFNEATPPPP